MKIDNYMAYRLPVNIAFTFLVVLAAQCLTIFFFGVDVPFADQWDAEVAWYKALVTHNVSWSALIAPHNEHRIAVTRLFNGAIFWALGGWRPIVVMYAQSVLIAAAIGGLCTVLAQYAGKWARMAITFTLIAFVLPYSWQNTLNGFQNQFYFMLLFAFAALWLMLRATWPALLAAIALAAISPFTMAAGLITIIVIYATAFLAFISQRLTRTKFIAVTVTLLPATIWHLTKLHHVSGHDNLRAHSLRELLTSLFKVFSWPEAPIGLILWGIIVYTVWRNWREKGFLAWLKDLQSIQIFVLGALLWLALQLAATAYSRTHADLMAARYMQTYSLLIPLFFLTLHVFALNTQWLRPWLIATLLVIGLAIRSGREWPYMLQSVAQTRFAKQETKKAVELNSLSYLKSKDKGDFTLGYFTAEGIWGRIHDEKLFPYHLWLR